MVGYARTATVRAQHPADPRPNPGDYYDYIDNGGPKPAISIIQDLDGAARGYGARTGSCSSVSSVSSDSGAGGGAISSAVTSPST